MSRYKQRARAYDTGPGSSQLAPPRTSSKANGTEPGKPPQAHPDDDPFAPDPLPADVYWAALTRGMSVIPQKAVRKGAYEKFKKVPRVRWQRYQREIPWRQVETWNRRWPCSLWAIVTGEASDIIGLDFDGIEGLRTFYSLGLKATTTTPSGGVHVWVTAPATAVRSRGYGPKYPGMEVKAEGSMATFCGTMPGGSRYTFDREAITNWWDLPEELRNYIESAPAPSHASAGERQGVEPPTASWVTATLGKALQKVEGGEARNQTGHWLAQQLWWQGCDRETVQHWMDVYREEVDRHDDPYTADEAKDTVRQVIEREDRREPQATANTNGPSSDVLAEVKRAMLAEDAEGSPDFYEGLVFLEDMRNLPPPDFVVGQWFERGGYSVLYGEAGIGKTALLADLALAVACGKPWMNCATTGGAVLYLTGEGLSQLRLRLGPEDAQHPLAFFETVDLSTPEGVARTVTTVRRMEEGGAKVQMIVVDPLIEYMSSDENGEGMHLASRGLRALGKLTDCAVVVGHHVNGEGIRERGNKVLRNRALGMTFVEPAGQDGDVTLLQSKLKNAARMAFRLYRTTDEQTIRFHLSDHMSVQEYEEEKERRKEGARLRKSAEKESGEFVQMRDLIVADLRREPAQTESRLCKRNLMGQGFSEPKLRAALGRLVADEVIELREDGRHATYSVR